jgi:formylmethanofuran dehydrogenase subunit E
VDTGAAVRIAPQPEVRELAWHYAPQERRLYFAMLAGYQRMPDEALLSFQPVRLTTPVTMLISRQGARALCAVCREEIINEREVFH